MLAIGIHQVPIAATVLAPNLDDISEVMVEGTNAISNDTSPSLLNSDPTEPAFHCV